VSTPTEAARALFDEARQRRGIAGAALRHAVRWRHLGLPWLAEDCEDLANEMDTDARDMRATGRDLLEVP
jgi:hypothetical protein